MGSGASVVSIGRVTSAGARGGLDEVPAKTTSSIFPPRSDFAPCSPMTQHSASTMFDLPDPFGPTAQVIPGSKRSVVAEAKDLNPRNVRLLRYTREHSSSFAFCRVAAISHPTATVRQVRSSAASRGPACRTAPPFPAFLHHHTDI